MTPKDSTLLSYFLAEQRSIVIVTLLGPLSRMGAPVLEKCLQELLPKSCTWVIINFRDVPPEIEATILPTLARFLKDLRTHGASLRLSSMHPALRERLGERGILREDELVNNLQEALKSLAQPAAKAAAAMAKDPAKAA